MDHKTTQERDVINFLLHDFPGDTDVPIADESPEEVYLKEARDSTSLFFERDDIHPMVYEFTLISKYQSEWIDWDPETLWEVINRDFFQAVGEIPKNKIQALRTLQSIDRYWREPEVFENVSLALNGIVPYFNVMEFLSPAQMAFSIEVASSIDDMEFSEDVGNWIVAMCSESGLFYLYPPLNIFNKHLTNLPHYDEVKNYKAIIGARTKASLESPDDIKLVDDSVVDVQVAKCIAIKQYLDTRDDQFAEQIIIAREMS